MMQCSIDGHHTPFMQPATTTEVARPLLVELKQTILNGMPWSEPLKVAVCVHCHALFAPPVSP